MTSAERKIFINAGFTIDQVEEIEEGRNAGLNTSVYANKNFLSIQMRQIRLGLQDKLPVAVYAKPEFDWFQMEEIREGLKEGVDVEVYARPEIPYEKMRQLRKGLQMGLNLSDYLAWDAGIIRELRKALCDGIDIEEYINEGYDAQQLYEIRHAIENGVDLAPYINNEFRAASIAEIYKGLESGLDVSIYAVIHYSWRQMREIRLGMENQIDIEKYCSRLYSWEQMKEIRLGLEQGLDVDGYRLLRYTAGEMREKRRAICAEIDREKKAILERRAKSGDFMFEFSSGNMEARVTLLAEDKIITREGFLEILEQNNIRKGILEDGIEKILSGKYIKQAILIAKGQIPYKGEDGWYEFFFRTNIEKKPKLLENGSVDYQNIEWFEMVKEGQKLAFYHEAKAGIDGYDVTGEIVKAQRGFEKKVLSGKGFKLEEDKKTYISMIDGKISLEDNEMSITNHLVLEEVTMATGNVRFNGSIHVLGDVGHGTVIQATNDVVIEGTVEAATIESGGSIVLKKGMNSAGAGLVSAKKDVVSKFFEAAKVVAEGNIDVNKCLNSQLYAGGIISSDRVIAGGIAQAEKGFQMKHVGNQAGLHTVIKLKISEKLWEEHRMIKNAISEVNQELHMLKNSYEEFKIKFPPEIRSSMDMFSKIENAVFTKEKQLTQLYKLEEEIEERVSKFKETKIVISGQAYEGTVLEVNGTRWLANNQYNITVRKKQDEMEVMLN